MKKFTIGPTFRHLKPQTFKELTCRNSGRGELNNNNNNILYFTQSHIQQKLWENKNQVWHNNFIHCFLTEESTATSLSLRAHIRVFTLTLIRDKRLKATYLLTSWRLRTFKLANILLALHHGGNPTSLRRTLLKHTRRRLKILSRTLYMLSSPALCSRPIPVKLYILLHLLQTLDSISFRRLPVHISSLHRHSLLHKAPLLTVTRALQIVMACSRPALLSPLHSLLTP